MMRSPFASDPGLSRGRLHAESLGAGRTPFERDRDRILHSTAFRRLKDKTQVFLFDEGDHYRTRLTHTLEVAQIARAIARSLHLDEDLAEALALAHDLGHPPFGHAGERALASAMTDHGGFDHNGQSLRVDVAGAALTVFWPQPDVGDAGRPGQTTTVRCWADGTPVARYRHGLPFAIASYAEEQDLWLGTYPSAEAQAAAIADDIAYDAHDIDDGLRAGLLSLDRLVDLPAARYRRRHPAPVSILRSSACGGDRAPDHPCDDRSDRGIAALARPCAPASADDVRMAGRPLIAFSPP